VSASESVRPRFWWVNQSRAFDVERDGGYVYAGKFTADGRIVQHHSDLTRLAPNDVTLHAARGELRAVGRVTGTAIAGIYKPPDRAVEEGWRVPVTYRVLTRPIAIRGFPENLRPQPPFNRNGTLRQGYCYPFPTDDAIELLRYFGDLSLPDLPAQ
jgi:hypothetical protein